MDRLLFGAAYYDEYMPTDRIETDVRMMQDAGINVVRIAESTWSTLEPQPGVFDFTHVDRALDAFEAADIAVIVGTPTYAVPSWLTAPTRMCWPPPGTARAGTAPGRSWTSRTRPTCSTPSG